MKRHILAAVASGTTLMSAAPVLASPADDTIRIASPWKIGALIPSASTALSRTGVVETLTMPTEEGDIVGLLAESWTSNDSLDEWRFKIRSGVTFHDGSPLTAETVAANLTKFREQSSLRIAPVASIASEGDEVIITLERPYSILPAILADWNTGIISAENLNDEPSDSVAGTGPFAVKDASDPTMLKLSANADYWGTQATISKVEYLFVPDAQARQAMAQAGEVEFAFSLPVTATQMLTGAENVDVNIQAIPRVRALKLNGGIAPLNEVAVRQAISYAIDRNGIAASIVGNPDTAATQLFPASLPAWHDTDLAPFAYDPARAAELLAEAGFEKGEDGILTRNGERFSIEMRTYDSRPELPVIGVAIQDMLKVVGIEVTMRAGDWTLISDGHTDGTLEAGMVSDSFVYVPDPIGALAENFYQGGGFWGSMNWNNAEFDALVETYQRAVDPDQLAQLRTDMVGMIHEEHPMVTVTWYDDVYAVSDAVANFKFDVYERDFGLNRLTWAE
ncbi:peptide/nickel transport system substrate-binding protein [Aliiroseovarius halocynthiae]|uniref:ABC transporter substrate-binding protein n=1 Tax=Aliiroseovarius halocynthiae TaxID=985055 RepID=A0A545SNN3_9RHOB|nr:ABC transporter substrate-binding protein [Aliiroseovarius halocynthiae]TQV66466.1 ABC transporter substrate-binding protein [Aliiroseovarius halocynthiae]SMR83616.1 peptide/nickel transport system substrate-binding protein [Aliiroseovarius halocynthiae]